MTRVAVVGHSQVPSFLDVEEVELKIFRAPGGRADGFYSDSRLNTVLEWEHDYCLLWLGSNDIESDTIPEEVVKDILEIVNSIEDNCGSTVYPVQVEPRFYSDDYPVSHDWYKKVQRAINRKLKRRLKGKCFIHFNTAYWVEHLAADGVHWDSEGKECVRDRLEGFIRRIVDDEVGSSESE